MVEGLRSESRVKPETTGGTRYKPQIAAIARLARVRRPWAPPQSDRTTSCGVSVELMSPGLGNQKAQQNPRLPGVIW